MATMKNLKLDELLEDLKDEAGKRASGVFGEGRKQARRATGSPDEGAVPTAFVLGILVGVALGALIALLVTPLSGEQARRKITEQVDKARGTGNDWQSATNGQPMGSAYQSTQGIDRV